MTMVRMLRQQTPRTARRLRGVAASLAVMAVVLGSGASPLQAQKLPAHYRHHSDMPPGAIGSAQLQRGGPLPGYFQPVEIKAPQGAEISLVAGGQFLDSQPNPVKAGLLVGGVYRFRVSQIPYQFGREVFPTVEVIDRLYPPGGQEARFPIVVEITQEDLEFALDGKFVTRVIYLEDPERALAASEDDIGGQNGFDVKPGDNPIEIADTMGRPMAILRLGAWLPINNQTVGSVDESLEGGLGPSLPLIRFPRVTPEQLQQGAIPGLIEPEDCPAGLIPTAADPARGAVTNPYALTSPPDRRVRRAMHAAAVESRR